MEKKVILYSNLLAKLNTNLPKLVWCSRCNGIIHSYTSIFLIPYRKASWQAHRDFQRKGPKFGFRKKHILMTQINDFFFLF